jgi:plasmid stabilization system protein ParE
MKIRWLSAAESDLAEALDYYIEESPMAAIRFNEELNEALLLINSSPYLFPIHKDELRVKFLPSFPFSILYAILPNEIVIEALAHQSRKPGYWRNRL